MSGSSKGEIEMEIKLIQIKEGQPALNKILRHPMDVKVSYRIRKIAAQLQTEMKNIEKKRGDLVRKHGNPDDKGYNVPKDKMEVYNKEFDEYLESVVQTTIKKIPFVCIKEIKISPAEMVLLEPFLEEPSEKELEEPKVPERPILTR